MLDYGLLLLLLVGLLWYCRQYWQNLWRSIYGNGGGGGGGRGKKEKRGKGDLSRRKKGGERDGGRKGVTSKVLCTDSAVREGGRQTEEGTNGWMWHLAYFFFWGGERKHRCFPKGKKAQVFFLKGGRQCPDGLAAFQKPKNRKKKPSTSFFPNTHGKEKAEGKKDEKGPHPRLTGGNNFPFFLLLPLQIPPPPFCTLAGEGGDLKFKREQKGRGEERMYFSCAWK